MAENKIQLFENQRIRTAWDDEREEWYFSVVDVISILTESSNPQAYWRKLKQRLKAEGNESVTSCHALKMKASDGKKTFNGCCRYRATLKVNSINSVP